MWTQKDYPCSAEHKVIKKILTGGKREESEGDTWSLKNRLRSSHEVTINAVNNPEQHEMANK